MARQREPATCQANVSGLLGWMPDSAIVREFRDWSGQRFDPVGELVVEDFGPRAPVVDLIGATHLDGNDSDRGE